MKILIPLDGSKFSELGGPHQLDRIGSKLSECPCAPVYDTGILPGDHLLPSGCSFDFTWSPFNACTSVDSPRSDWVTCPVVLSAFFYRESHDAAPLRPGPIVNSDMLQIQHAPHGEPGNRGSVAQSTVGDYLGPSIGGNVDRFQDSPQPGPPTFRHTLRRKARGPAPTSSFYAHVMRVSRANGSKGHRPLKVPSFPLQDGHKAVCRAC
jgi:hypothetical protein